MANITVHTRIHTETLSSNLQSVLDNLEDKILSDSIKRQSAELLMKYSNKYVPQGATRKLRESAKVVPYGDTYAVEYFAEGEPSKKTGKPRLYAKPQYHANDVGWNRATPGTYSHWNRHITKAEKLSMYDELKRAILEEVNHG